MDLSTPIIPKWLKLNVHKTEVIFLIFPPGFYILGHGTHTSSFTKPETWESVIPNSSPSYPTSHQVLLILPLNTS